MSVLGTLVMTTAIAGVVGTGLGGLIGALLQKDSNRIVSLLLSFAGGVMISVVCFDLVVEAIETEVGIGMVIFAIALGVAVIYLLNWIIDKRTNPQVPHIDENHPKTADDLDELIHSDHLEQHYLNNDSKLSLFIAGVVMASAIALHNVPEGMTIGAAYASDGGVMGATARGIEEENGKTIGITPGFFNVDGMIYENCDELIRPETMRDRKKMLEEMSDAFITAPGGIGTFDEFFEILTLKQLSRHTKAIVIFNVNGYFDALLAMIETGMKQEFIKEECRELYRVFDDADEMLDYLESYVPQDLDILNFKNI